MASPSESKPPSARPSVRRKSSASNLLIQSFGGTNKGGGAGPTVSALASPLGVGGITAVALNGVMYPSKLDTDSISLSTTGESVANSVLNSLDELQEHIRKRIVSLTYLRNVHEGKAHWIGTIHLSRADLERAFPNAAMKKRTTRYAVLAMSLASVLDFNGTISDFLQTIMEILGAYDALADDVLARPRGVRMNIPGFRGSRLRGGAPTDLSDAYLTIPNIPYPLDYTQVLLSFIDILSELYHKMGTLMAQFQTNQSQNQVRRGTISMGQGGPGPGSPPPMSATSSVGPSSWSSAGATSVYSTTTASTGTGTAGTSAASWALPGPPLQGQHGIEYLRTLASPGTGVEEILELAEGVAAGKIGMSMADMQSPTATSTGVVEHAKKVDEKFKVRSLPCLCECFADISEQKMLSKLFSELDELARETIRNELRNLDPLLRTVTDDPYDNYDI